ncbi:MAG: hypothetical protein LAO22_00410 [Acidobacteriia bacterium]|nr:hypothetical protein [Terriglobia bacterium]
MQKVSDCWTSLVRHVSAVATLVLLFCLAALAARDFVMPSAHPARTYPAHDEHSQEKVTVAVDPYDMGDKAQIFSTDFSRYGYLPVFFVVTNDGDQPVSLSGMKAELITVQRTKLYPATNDDLMRRMSNPRPKTGPSPLPIPIPGSKVKGAVNRKTREEIEQAQFGARAVEPHSTAAGFLFFDVADIASPALAGANFYLTGVRDAGGHELMYFEIPMEKYLSAPPVKKP